MSRIVGVEKRIHGDTYRVENVAFLQTRLKNLELSMDVGSDDLSIDGRVTRVEKSFDQRVMDLEKEVYKNTSQERKKVSVSDRMERLRKEIGLEVNESTQLSQFSKLASLEK
eukprot:8234215-Ditylum_brightwellii.AAC.1